MKTKKIQSPPHTRRSLLFCALALIAMLIASCSKDEIELEESYNVSLILVLPEHFESKKEYDRAKKLRPITAFMKTDKGNYQFHVEKQGNRYLTNTMLMPGGEIRIKSIKLYDDQVKETHYVFEGSPKAMGKEGEKYVSWLNPDLHRHVIDKDRDFVFQIWISK